jgi:hypothetical protein
MSGLSPSWLFTLASQQYRAAARDATIVPADARRYAVAPASPLTSTGVKR